MSSATSAISALAQALPSARAHRLLILIYHRVHPRPDPMFPNEVDAERFDWQMALLRRHFNPIPLAAGVAGLEAAHLPPRAVAITFDDGYADNESVAFPILKKHGIPATFFIATGFLDGGRMWNDSIIEAIRTSDARKLDLRDYGLGIVDLVAAEERGRVAQSIINVVKHLPPQERQARVTTVCERLNSRLPDDLMMNSSQVRRLAEHGMEVGAHTKSHPILKTLSDEAARAEIEGSRQVLAGITGRPVKAFAYPNGKLGTDYTRRDRDLVAELGFEYAPSTQWGAASATSDRYQLPRFTPWDRTPTRWLARLLLTYGRPA